VADDDLRAKGRAMRRELFGPRATDELDREVYEDDPIMAKFGDLTQDIIFGTLWSREGLDLKTRSLITAVSDVATGQTEALRVHLQFCRRHGWSEDELVEVMLHLMGYVGVPLVRKALLVASETFAALRADDALEWRPSSG
jgi:4-carboxymuconolactone decarboxylase